MSGKVAEMRIVCKERRAWKNGLLGTAFAVLCVLAVFDISALAKEPAAKDDRFDRWLPAMSKFEKEDQQKPFELGGIVFVGSSSIRLWDLEKWFGDLKPTPLNRGFGGSQIADATHFVEQLLIQHQPRTVVLYAGDNDTASGKSAERVESDFAKLCQKIHDKLPKADIVFIAIKPSPSRWRIADVQRDANSRIRKRCESDERLEYVDVWTPMLNDDGQPRRELFREDMLHLNDAGYELWTELLRPFLGES